MTDKASRAILNHYLGFGALCCDIEHWLSLRQLLCSPAMVWFPGVARFVCIIRRLRSGHFHA